MERVNILMVDDQPAKLLSYEAILGERGENLIKARSGNEALEYLLKTDIAVVLMDVRTPELDGFEVAQMIRSHPRFQKTRLSLISAEHLTDTDRLIGYRIRQGDPGIVVVFEERPQVYAERAGSFGLDLKTPRKEKKLEILYLRPLDLSVDETMHEILDAVQRIGAKRLVMDSLAGFEMALAPGFRADFRESLYRMITALTGAGVTILSTVEVNESFTEFPFSTYSISFLTDDIIRLRYVCNEGQLRKILVVIKMRGGNHSKDIREYEITSKVWSSSANASRIIKALSPEFPSI